MNSQTKQLKGFTIIEVVLVLAIAALIFLMVFIALPALQANQRDGERKQDASIVSAAVTDYVAGERKALVEGAAEQTLFRTYIDGLSTQYTGPTSVVVRDALNPAPTADQILVHPGAQCNGSSAETASNARKAAVVLLLDNGTSTYCVDAS